MVGNMMEMILLLPTKILRPSGSMQAASACFPVGWQRFRGRQSLTSWMGRMSEDAIQTFDLSLSLFLSLSLYIYIYIYTYSGVNRLLVSLHPQQYTLYRNKWYIAVSIASLSVSHAQYRIRQDALRHWWHCNPWLQLSSAGFDWARARCLESLAGFDWARALAALIEMEP